MGARFYDPTLGRWLSEDPVQDNYFEPATLNFYAYVNGNPLVLVDPDGRSPIAAAVVIALPGPAILLAAALIVTVAYVVYSSNMNSFGSTDWVDPAIERFARKLTELLRHARTDKELLYIQDPRDPKKHKKEVKEAKDGLKDLEKQIKGALRNPDLSPEQKERLEKLLKDIQKKIEEIDQAQKKAGN